MLSSKQLTQEVKQILPTVQRLSPVLISEETANTQVSLDNEQVDMMIKRHQGKLYLWLLNMTKSKQTTLLSLPIAHGLLINEIRPGRKFEFADGRYEIKLEPLQPMVLRVEPAVEPVAPARDN